jgi:N-acetylglucosamine kinase-like BadF-type ATPase
VTKPAVVAVDGGTSRIDAVAITRNGSLLAGARVGPWDGQGGARDPLAAVPPALEALCGELGIEPSHRPVGGLGAFCLAGAQVAADDRRILRWLREQGWTDETLLRNDTFAVLRAGTVRTWGVGVVCGFGTSCSAVAPDGRTYRVPALGWIAGDWGGGTDIGQAALWHALRSQDGRGERTALAATVPAHFGLRRPRQVMEAMYFGWLSQSRVAELAPLVFGAAADGDAVARSIVDRQANEVVVMAAAAIAKLRMATLDVDVVLGGGVFRNAFEPFFRRIEEGIRATAPKATVRVLTAPRVVGAALLALDHLGATGAAKAKVRAALADDAGTSTLGVRQEG